MKNSNQNPSYSAASACYRFVVAHRIVPKGDVIHAALRSGTRFERFEDDVYHPLRRQYIAADYGRFHVRIKKRAVGYQHFDGH